MMICSFRDGRQMSSIVIRIVACQNCANLLVKYSVGLRKKRKQSKNPESIIFGFCRANSDRLQKTSRGRRPLGCQL